jgi:hypothetical protein
MSTELVRAEDLIVTGVDGDRGAGRASAGSFVRAPGLVE